jgi:hypothetical protein
MNHIEACEALEAAGFKWAGTTAEFMTIHGNRWAVHVREYCSGRLTCRVLIVPSGYLESIHGKQMAELRQANRESVAVAISEAAVNHVMEVCA